MLLLLLLLLMMLLLLLSLLKSVECLQIQLQWRGSAVERSGDAVDGVANACGVQGSRLLLQLNLLLHLLLLRRVELRWQGDSVGRGGSRDEVCGKSRLRKTSQLLLLLRLLHRRNLRSLNRLRLRHNRLRRDEGEGRWLQPRGQNVDSFELKGRCRCRSR